MKRRFIRDFAQILSTLTVFLMFPTSQAEPWLSNRYAQNCAACHSPSRRNVAPSERRCTLSCQGCHVNPNGGGLRNEYGVWNQQRWLRSFKTKWVASKGTPAPLKYQKYGSMPNTLSAKDKKKWARMAKDGASLVVTPGTEYNEKDYDKSDKQEHIDVASRAEFMARLTEDDPYRVERRQSVFGGGDFRYFYLDYKKEKTQPAAVDEKYTGQLAMSFDMGLKVRPIKEHASLVFENRFFQSPNANVGQSDPLKVFTSGSQVRSAYLLVDDLPYATYVMYGLYRPQFGHYNPDHTTLLNNVMFADNTSSSFDDTTATSAKAYNRALTIGGSPNVPFFNLHMIMPTEGSTFISKEKGFAATAGGRFVTLGASFMLSWWSTKGPRGIYGELKNDMLGLTGGLQWRNLTFNFDYTSVKRENAPGTSDAGVVSSFEVKYRAWREVYGVFNYSGSNVARNLRNGNATEMMYGVKSYLLAGTEFEFLLINRHDRDDNNHYKTDTNAMQAQVHLFF